MRITELPQSASVAQTDDLAIDVPGGRTYRVPRSILAPAPYIATIPTGQWSGSGSDYYITVTASNVTANAMLYPFFDNASAALLNGPVWVIPADGSFTIHTSAIPSGTVTISVLLAGIVGEAQYQVLADVYSRAQVDTIVSQSTAYVPTTTHGLTAGTGVSLDSNQVSKLSIGKLRIYAFVFTATSSISAESPLITGFDSVRGSANGIYSCVLFNNNTRTEQKFAFMHGQSYLCCTTAIAANTTWRGNIVYMAA